MMSLTDVNRNQLTTTTATEFKFTHINNSLRCKRNLTLVSNVCEAAPRSLFSTPNGLKESPGVCFEFPFLLISKSTMDF